jgi:hypothetical protein
MIQTRPNLELIDRETGLYDWAVQGLSSLGYFENLSWNHLYDEEQ